MPDRQDIIWIDRNPQIAARNVRNVRNNGWRGHCRRLLQIWRLLKLRFAIHTRPNLIHGLAPLTKSLVFPLKE